LQHFYFGGEIRDKNVFLFKVFAERLGIGLDKYLPIVVRDVSGIERGLIAFKTKSRFVGSPWLATIVICICQDRLGNNERYEICAVLQSFFMQAGDEIEDFLFVLDRALIALLQAQIDLYTEGGGCMADQLTQLCDAVRHPCLYNFEPSLCRFVYGANDKAYDSPFNEVGDRGSQSDLESDVQIHVVV
jgi:hypothetical protein